MTKTSHCVLVALQPALYSPCISSNKIWMLKLLLQLVILCLMKKTYPCSCNRMLNVIRWSAVKISIIVVLWAEKMQSWFCRKLYIADARPRKNALANGAMGGGSESSSNYFQSEVGKIEFSSCASPLEDGRLL